MTAPIRTGDYLPDIDGRTATPRDAFDREQWTTCALGGLEPGTVISLPGDPDHHAVLGALDTWPDPRGGTVGRTRGVVRDAVTGDPQYFDLAENTPVLTRCDLAYE